jgi:hypothetical protein
MASTEPASRSAPGSVSSPSLKIEWRRMSGAAHASLLSTPHSGPLWETTTFRTSGYRTRTVIRPKSGRNNSHGSKFCSRKRSRDIVKSCVLETGASIDAVGPPINVTLLTQVTLTPCLVISLPTDFESHDVSGRQAGGFLTQDRCQGFSKISSRDSLEIQRRDQCVDAGCPAHKPGQNRTGEPSFVTMPYPMLTNFNGTNSSDDLPLWQMPVAYHQPLPILITSILVELNERPLPRFRSRPAIACALPCRFAWDRCGRQATN